MRTDQRHNEQGQFTQRSGYDGSSERLECVVGCKVSEHDLRRFSIMFDQHRKEFGWQTTSDMYRALLQDGFAVRAAKIKNPTKEMKSLVRQVEEVERIEAGAFKHRRLDATLERIERSVETAFRAGDLQEVRRQLGEFQAKTKAEDDSAVKQRRQMEWEAKYQRMWDSLNRPMSLDPSKYERD